MKTIQVRISDDSVASDAIQTLESQMQDSMRKTPEYQMIFGEVINCINEFTEKAKKLARTGTTIKIAKTFSFPEVDILITLEYPRQNGFIDRLKLAFKKS